jgi:hypothetical protein
MLVWHTELEERAEEDAGARWAGHVIEIIPCHLPTPPLDWKKDVSEATRRIYRQGATGFFTH